MATSATRRGSPCLQEPSGFHRTFIKPRPAGLVFKLPFLAHSRISPYALAEGGALVFDPAGNEINSVAGAQTQAKAAFVYGAGFSYAVTRRLSLRMEYRGLVYDTPNFAFNAFSTNSITHTVQPSVGFGVSFLKNLGGRATGQWAAPQI